MIHTYIHTGIYNRMSIFYYNLDIGRKILQYLYQKYFRQGPLEEKL